MDIPWCVNCKEPYVYSEGLSFPIPRHKPDCPMAKPLSAKELNDAFDAVKAIANSSKSQESK